MDKNMNDKLACASLELIEKSIEEINKKGTVSPAELDSLKKAYELRMALQGFYEDGMEMSERGASYGRYVMRGSYDGNSQGYRMGGSYANNSQGQGSYGMMYEEGNSQARGRSPVTGRYVSRDGMMYEDRMSGHSIKDRMVARLEAMYDEAKSEHEREEIRKEIRRIESER